MRQENYLYLLRGLLSRLSTRVLTTLTFLTISLLFLFNSNQLIAMASDIVIKDKTIVGNTGNGIIEGDMRFPVNVLLLDNFFSHHIIVVEKSTHRLHLYKNNNSYPEYLFSYPIATGLTAGNKSNRGDLKTPEGIYQLTGFLPSEALIRQYGEDGKKYGIGAFVTDYPNIIDKKDGKTGGGIWLHSTNDESRLLKGLDSKGCVVLANQNLKELSRYIELNATQVIIVQDLLFLRKETWEKNREEITARINGWIKAWNDKEFNRYISYYHNEYHDSQKGNLRSFKNYKMSVFQKPGKPIIKIKEMSIAIFDRYAVVQFEQYYKSNIIDDTGRKLLYLKKDENYDWKIVSELFYKLNSTSEVAFNPSMRFFKDSKEIKNDKI
ncbi:MAG: L,D-transpeptidase family protein [Oligoflexia bacterium]|nr:L,D-transpeptidase family protein [Oligoflexia bacterium]